MTLEEFRNFLSSGEKPDEKTVYQKFLEVEIGSREELAEGLRLLQEYAPRVYLLLSQRARAARDRNRRA